MNKHAINRDGIKDFYKVSVGWIDKIPVAGFQNQVFDHNKFPIKQKVELGDLLLISSRNDITNNRASYRASIIQAKVAKVEKPSVPITKLGVSKPNSTSKELALLSHWPIFDLYRTATTSLPEINAQNLDVGKDDKQSKFMGYFEKSWYCGFPNYNELCEISFGEHIKDVVTGYDGRPFVRNSTSGDWNILINKVLAICSEYNLPDKYYGPNKRKRLVNGDFLLLSFISEKCNATEDFDFGSEAERRLPIILVDAIQIEGEGLKFYK